MIFLCIFTSFYIAKINNLKGVYSLKRTDFFSMDLSKPPIFSEDEYFTKKYIFYLSNERLPQERRNIKISLFEQNLLKLVAKQQGLSLHQLYRIYTAYHPIKYSTLRAKLNRWAKKNILHLRKPNVKNAMMVHNVYSIGRLGLELLSVEDGKKWLAINEDIFKDKNNYVHGIGQQEMVVQLMLHYMQHDIHFQSIAPYDLFGEDKSLGVPDWFLIYEDENKVKHHFYLEFDGKSKKLSALNNKHQLYIQRAIENPEQKINVLYSLLDEEFHYRMLKEPSGPKRVSNFKSYFSNDIELPKNLTINVHYLHRIGPATEYLFFPQDHQSKLEILKDHFTSTLNLSVNEMLSDGFYLRETPEHFYADKIWELRNSNGKLEERILIVAGQEGDIRNYQRINHLYSSMKKRRFSSTIHRLIIIYEDELSSLSDSIGTKFDHSVLITDKESLKNNNKPFKKFYGIFKTTDTSYPINNE